MIGEEGDDTGLDTVLPGILVDIESDTELDINDCKNSQLLHLRIKNEYDLESEIKTELPDSCSDFLMLVSKFNYETPEFYQ